MNYRNMPIQPIPAEDADDDCSTESTQTLIRQPSGYYFDIVLEIIQVHTRQKIEIP